MHSIYYITIGFLLALVAILTLRKLKPNNDHKFWREYTLHWLALGWALHICWDVFLHSQNSTPYVPEGYPGLCMGFDIVIAGYILYLIRERAGIRVEQNG